MSDPIIETLSYFISKIYVYMGSTVIIGGVLGGLANIIIFLSLQIYRSSPSAFYLIVVSLINIGQLLSGLLSRVIFNIADIDWSESSYSYCKIRNYLFQFCAVASPACLCLATVDQFLATCSRPEWQQRSNTKTAHRLSAIVILIWLLYGLTYLNYYNLVVSTSTGKSTCIITNSIFSRYYNDFHVPVLMCVIPLLLTILFGLLAYSNIRQISHRTVPLVRRRHEIQLTTMVLVQVVFNIFATTPCYIVLTFASHTNLTQDPIASVKIRLAIAITTCLYYLYYAIPFYIYICVSQRFRKQFYYVVIGNHYNRCRTNQIVPTLPNDRKSNNSTC